MLQEATREAKWLIGLVAVMMLSKWLIASQIPIFVNSFILILRLNILVDQTAFREHTTQWFLIEDNFIYSLLT